MTEQLLVEIQALEEELTQLDPRTAAHDEVLARLELKKVELAAQTAQEELFGEFERISVGDVELTMREMCASEQHYQLLSGWLQSREGDRAAKHAAIESSYKSQVTALEDQLSELEQYRKKSMDLEDRLADMEMKRDAAADELHNAKEEVKRLTADNAALRSQLEAQSKPVVTNATADLAEIAKKLHEQKPAIYNKRWEDDLRKVNFVAQLAESGEWITIPRLEIGRYRELSEEDAARFRAELAEKAAAEAERVAAENLANQTLVAPPLHFPPSEEGELNGLAQEPSSMAGSPVTREEYERDISDIRSRLDALEQTQNVGRGAA